MLACWSRASSPAAPSWLWPWVAVAATVLIAI